MVYLLSRSIAQGRRAGVAAALGINAGGYIHLLAAVSGLSAILLTSAAAFTVVKWAGALYLVYLGINAILSRSAALDSAPDGVSGGGLAAIFWQGFLSDVLNPKVAIFFLALLPQFVHGQGREAVWQLMLLGLTVNVIAIAINLVLVTISAWISGRPRANTRIRWWMQKAMGAMFIGLGVRLAAERP